MASDKAPPPAAAAETAPDPDEDDLDDLDEMLEEFKATKVSGDAAKQVETSASAPAAAPPPAAGPARPDAPAGDEDEFARQLQAGMAEMLKDLEQNPEMAKQFEELMAQFGGPPPEGGQGIVAAAQAAAGVPPSPPAASTSSQTKPAPKAGSKPEDAFQDTIRRTMERMKESSSSAAAASTTSGGEDDMMASLLRELASGEGGADGEDGFSKMLLGMMEQLTNKAILYEPMKELNTKFPPWLADNAGALSPADRDRYTTQQRLVKDIVARFERPGYNDSNTDDREYIVEKMQEMQAAGAPPPDLVGDVNAAEDLMGGADSGCPQQ